jgi:hypothetical protein
MARPGEIFVLSRIRPLILGTIDGFVRAEKGSVSYVVKLKEVDTRCRPSATETGGICWWPGFLSGNECDVEFLLK